MKVKLLQMTQNPIDIMWVAARTCYSEKSPVEIWFNAATVATDKKWKLVKQVIGSGHDSISQHINLTFAIEGISRACSLQLVRHRLAVYSQKSQRYVEIKESREELDDLFNSNDYGPEHFETSKIGQILNKYFTKNEFKNVNGYYHALDEYLYAISNGEKPEDARRFLPNATKTDLVMTMNLGELKHVCNLRLCSRSQLEIRQLFQEIKKEVAKVQPKLATLLVPSCEANHGICFEHKSCGKCPTIEEVIGAYKGEYRDGI